MYYQSNKCCQDKRDLYKRDLLSELMNRCQFHPLNLIRMIKGGICTWMRARIFSRWAQPYILSICKRALSISPLYTEGVQNAHITFTAGSPTHTITLTHTVTVQKHPIDLQKSPIHPYTNTHMYRSGGIPAHTFLQHTTHCHTVHKSTTHRGLLTVSVGHVDGV